MEECGSSRLLPAEICTLVEVRELADVIGCSILLVSTAVINSAAIVIGFRHMCHHTAWDL